MGIGTLSCHLDHHPEQCLLHTSCQTNPEEREDSENDLQRGVRGDGWTQNTKQRVKNRKIQEWGEEN
ncbi:hypothetical protein H671_5g14984 [Cricetulus griseus]|nr:hypothetical protein H671_5g14984 [Cricetulus griseus]